MRTHCRKAIKVAPKSPHFTLQTNIQKSSLNTGTSRTIPIIANPLLRKNQVVLESISPQYRQQVNRYSYDFNKIFTNSITPLVQAKSSKKRKIKKYRLIRILNRLSRKITYRYRWRNKPWRTRNISKNNNRNHSFRYKGKKPRFQIRFDADPRSNETKYKTLTLKTNRNRGKKPNFSVATNYAFARVSDNRIRLIRGIKDPGWKEVNYDRSPFKWYNPFTWLTDRNHRTARIKGKAFVKGKDDSKIDPNDVKQGSIGDCWLMAAMAAIARVKPQAIERLIKTRDKKRGLYDVTIYIRKEKRNIPQVITVNDRFPIKTNGQKPPRAKQGDKNELWVMLIEKAYAVHLGSYQALKGGHSYKAMEALTGKKSRIYKINKINNINNFIKTRLDVGHPLVASSSKDKVNSSTDKFKLLTTENHAYVVLGIDSSTIKLHNPWGKKHPDPIPLSDFKNLFYRIQVGGKL